MLVEAKSNLARLMATENLVIEERNVPTAFFDIHSRVLTVPILNGNLSPQLYDLLLGHEVGHALETPAEGWHDSIVEHKVNKSILNVCEDVRIEKKIKRRFPGLKPSFVRAYAELMEMDFFDVKDKDLNELNFIDRVNLYTKGGPAQGILFSSEETAILREIESTETWNQVVAIARKVQEFMKAELEEQGSEKKKIKIKVSDDGEDDLSEEELESIAKGDSDFEVEESDDDNPSVTVDGEDTKSNVIAKKQNETQNENKGEKTKEGGEASNKRNPSDVDSKTDNSFREREKQLYDTKGKRDVIYSNIPKLQIDKLIVSHKEILREFKEYNVNNTYIYSPTELRKQFTNFKNESNKVVSYLVKEFELRKNATQQSRAKVSKTGELNMDRIHEYKITDDIFARMTKIPNGKSHGLVMFIDWSGSMQDKIHATIKQLLNLVMFCKKVNIPFDVYAFTTQWAEETYSVPPTIQKPAVGDICVEKGFHLLNLFNERMSAIEYTEMASFLLDIYADKQVRHSLTPTKMRLGGTPLNQTIVAAFELIPEFKKNKKIDIVNAVFLTDGESGSVGTRYEFKEYNKNFAESSLWPSGKRRSIFRDPVTKATAEPVYVYGYSSMSSEETMALLKLLKQRANCNLMGFYVASARDIRSAFELYTEAKESKDYFERKQRIDKMMTVFRKEKVHVIENVGYDEYYLIGSSSLETDDDELVINTTTTRGLVSAFSKYTGGKVGSRIILNRFIKMIA